MGIIGGLMAMLVFTVLLTYSLDILTQLSLTHNCRSYHVSSVDIVSRRLSVCLYPSLRSYISRFLVLQQLMHKVLGSKWGRACEILILVDVFGNFLGYIVAFGDTIQRILADVCGPDSLMANRAFFTAVLALPVVMPLSLLKDINKLAFTSFLAVLGCVYLSFLVTVRGVQTIATSGLDPGRLQYLNASTQFFIGLPLVLYAC